jgi:hypothetical protein
MACIDLAKDRNEWKALVNTVMNLRVPENDWKFLSKFMTQGLTIS